MAAILSRPQCVNIFPTKIHVTHMWLTVAKEYRYNLRIADSYSIDGSLNKNILNTMTTLFLKAYMVSKDKKTSWT